MARSATDATRFTATRPYAQSSIKSPAGTEIPLPRAYPNESHRHRVDRLREAARLARASREPLLERIIIHGRTVADKLHRATILFLMGSSVILTGLTVYKFTEMLIYNRRKGRAYYLEQEKNYGIALMKAIEAEKAGTLTPDLALVLNKERAVLAYEEEVERKGSILKQARDWMFGGLSFEESPGGRLGKGGFDAEEIKRIAQGEFAQQGLVVNKTRDPYAREIEPEVMVKEAAAVKEQEREARERGGYLDQVADGTVSDVQTRSRRWWSWATGR